MKNYKRFIFFLIKIYIVQTWIEIPSDMVSRKKNCDKQSHAQSIKQMHTILHNLTIMLTSMKVNFLTFLKCLDPCIA